MELLKNMVDRLELKEKRAKAAYMDGIDSLEEYKQNKLLIQKERETPGRILKATGSGRTGGKCRQ